MDDERAYAAFLGYLRDGLHRSTAAEAVGWSGESVDGWLRRGRGADPRGLAPTPRYVQFAKDVRHAEAQIEPTAIRRLVNNKDWHAIAWVLERRFPDRWGPNASGTPAAPPAVPQQTFIYVDARVADDAIRQAIQARAVSLGQVSPGTLIEDEDDGRGALLELGRADEPVTA